MTNPRFQMSADARLLMQELQKASIGDLINDEALSSTIAKPISTANGALRTAFKRLLRDHDMVFGRIRKEGWKRLNDSEIVASGVSDVERIRRHSNRSVERQMKADFSKLSTADKSRFTAQVSILGSVAMMTKPSSVSKVAALAPSDKAELPIAATLKMFSTPNEN